MGAQTLPGGMAIDKCLDLADDLGVAAGLEVRVDSFLDRRKPLLLQSCDLGLCERLEFEVGQRQRRARGRALPASCVRALYAAPSSRGQSRSGDESASDRPGRVVIASAYPGGFVTSTSAPSVFRSCEMKFWSEVLAVRGGCSAHSESIKRSVDTAFGASRRRSASTARCFSPPSRSVPVSSTTSSGPRIRKSGM